MELIGSVPGGKASDPAISIHPAVLAQPKFLSRAFLEPESHARVAVIVCVISRSKHFNAIYVARNHTADGCRFNDIAIRHTKLRATLLAQIREPSKAAIPPGDRCVCGCALRASEEHLVARGIVSGERTAKS